MPTPRRNIAIVTGTRAEFGLLRSVIDAVRAHPGLRLQLVAAGSHFLPPGRTIREVEAAYPVAARVPMQKPRERRTREADALATARGVAGFAAAFARLRPEWVVVLGDRIEAFAAASAASIAGIGVCHVHGGDRAEGVADEAMRHAITKLAHLHCAASTQSARRIIAMGERRDAVHVTGSPGIDGLAKIKPMTDREARTLGDPVAVVLVHPCGLGEPYESHGGLNASLLARAASKRITGREDRLLLLEPNHDPGREEILETYLLSDTRHLPRRAHLPRAQFVALLKRLAKIRGGVLIGNSSAGLIEAAAIGLPVVNFPPRQNGRERDANVLDAQGMVFGRASGVLRPIAALDRAQAMSGRLKPSKRFGDGRAGRKIAALLAATEPQIRKRNTY